MLMTNRSQMFILVTWFCFVELSLALFVVDFPRQLKVQFAFVLFFSEQKYIDELSESKWWCVHEITILESAREV